MPSVPKEKENEIKRCIRDSIALNPLATINNVRDYLQSQNFVTARKGKLDRHYVAKLIHKVRVEAESSIKYGKINSRISELKERYRVVYERLAGIAFYSKEMREIGIPPPQTGDMIRALEVIVKLDLSILSAEITCGVYSKNELPKKLADEQLPTEKKEAIQRVLFDWGAMLDGPEKKLVNNIEDETTGISKKEEVKLPESTAKN